MLVNTSIIYLTLEAAALKSRVVSSGTFFNPVVDHQLYANPYIHINDRIFYVARFISYIMDESKRVIQGSMHKSDWYFYHNTLLLMITTTTMMWMEDKTLSI